MNKKLLVGVFSAFMAMSPWIGNAAQTIDAPHLNLTSGCENCHFAGLAPGDCTTNCHQSNLPPYADTVSPVAITHQGLACQACHNPHVSLQGTGITGAYTAIDTTTSPGMTILSGVNPTPDASWAAKTSAQRGMILWVPDGTTENASYEVKAVDATAGTVTVKGTVAAASGSFDLRRGQLIAQKVTKTAGESYKVGTLPVQFPATQGQPFVDTVNGTPKGICQVCHTATTHWKSDGTLQDHNAGLACTSCHKHDAGFLVTGCNACHQGVGDDGVPVASNQLAIPTTGSATAGQHQIHAVDYAFPCATCHVGTGMDRINDPQHPIADGKIQIGFNWGKYLGYLTKYNGQSGVTYEGTNHTQIDTTGAAPMTCDNVYCHSDGKAVRLGCATATTNSSPKWDGSSADPQGDTEKCNNCHGYTIAFANPMSSGKHTIHGGLTCNNCHSATVALDSATPPHAVIATKANHANGTYDIKGGGIYWGAPITLEGTIAYGTMGGWDPTTKRCTVVCHGGNAPAAWVPNDTATCPDVCSTVSNADPVILPYAFPNDPINTADVSQAFVYANDPNTLHMRIRAYDPDNMDPVMNQCRKGSDPANPTKGGHYNQEGFIRTVFADQCQSFSNTVFPNAGASDKELTCRYSTAKLAATGGKFCWTYIISDNDPTSYNTLASGNWTALRTNLSDGIAAPYSLGVNPVEWACINPTINPAVVIDDPMNNVLPEVTKTITKSGKQITLTFNAKDTDQVDSAKQAYWQGKYPTRTGGHSVSANHYIQVNWSNEAMTIEKSTPTNPTALQFTASGGSKSYSYDYNSYIGTTDAVTITNTTGQLKPLGTGKARTNVWIQAFVCDNHMLGTDINMARDCYDTGWFQVFF